MKHPRDEIDNPSYPDFLQKAWIGYVFRVLYPFTDDDVSQLTTVYRLLWAMGEKPKKRRELLRVLTAIKAKKIEEEKQRLVAEIKKLEEL